MAGVGFVLLGTTLLRQGIEGAGGLGGIDAIAYLTAARNLADGAPLYAIPEGSFAAYAYPPPLAQLLVPIAGMPTAAFVWAWRAVEVVCLRIAVGSWVRVGWMLLAPPVIAEIDAGNVHLVMAAVCALVMRASATAAVPAGLLKFASLPLVPLGWFRDRSGLLRGVGLSLVIVTVSLVIAPDRWLEYGKFLAESEFPSGWYNLAEAVPVPLRLTFALVLGLAAVRWVRLAPIAVVLAYPVVWLHALSTLVAVVTPLDQVRVTVRLPELVRLFRRPAIP